LEISVQSRFLVMQASRQRSEVETKDLEARERTALRKWGGTADADRSLLRRGT
jgi:hypothetical protein